MKKSTRIWNWLSFLFSVIFVIFAFIGQAQTCSVPLEVINAKYWEYKENFNKHFILIDRDPSGCVRDGIGQQSGNLCEFSKAGYSLPATSINMAPNGGYGMKDRNKGDDPETPEWLEDTDCAEAGPDPGTSYEPGANKHNYLDVGSETPQQLGWYWVTLATEYELLRRNGQLDEAQRTLEELFLALQAYRRLDMQAQCMAKKRYDEITDDFEVENCDFISTPFDCLCGKKYWGKDEVHSSFGVPCYDNCIWQPDLSGYSGFFLREDATQGLEALHDLSEDQYNIDLVSSDYAMSLSPPCLTTFSQPCYLAHRQNYMSQDQLVGLMIGLTIIKKYIPENAEVTTCEGVKFKPLEMAKKISNALVDRLDDTHNNKISFPGSDECCLKRAVFSNAEGGQAMAIIHGLKKAADYIDDHDRHSNVDEYFAWSIGLRGVVQLSYSAEGNFWLKLKALGWDMGEERNATKTLFNSAVQTQGQEILTLINNLLYPGGENLSTDQSFFAEMLCSAPCGGPCIRREPYEGESSSNWPIFNCSNHPDWRGQRWENNRAAKTPNRLFNGLDFMALYNIYLLHYNQVPEDYFNPAGAEGAGKSFYADKISGPSVLCKDQTAYYEAQQIVGAPTSSGPSHWFEEIHWTSSSNFNILTPNTNGTDIEATADANPSYIEAKVMETRHVPQYWTDGTIQYTTDETSPFYPQRYTFDDCTFILRKPITVGVPGDYLIETEFDHCNNDYWFRAIGPDLDDATYLWTLEYSSGGGNNGLLGKEKHLTYPFPGGNSGGGILITLKVTTDCGERTFHTFRTYDCQVGERSLVIAPNPGNDQVFVGITDEYTIATEGLAVRFINTGTGAIQGTRNIYSNGESVDISDFPEGTYNVQTTLNDSSVLNAAFIIARD